MTRTPSQSSRVIAVITVVAAIALTAAVTSAQTAQLLPPIAAVSRAVLMQEGVMQGGDVRQGPLTSEDQMLVRRWSELFANLLLEFRADHRDPVANIEGDFTTRELRIRRSAGDDAWVKHTLTKQELATADLRALAKKLYSETK